MPIFPPQIAGDAYSVITLLTSLCLKLCPMISALMKNDIGSWEVFFSASIFWDWRRCSQHSDAAVVYGRGGCGKEKAHWTPLTITSYPVLTPKLSFPPLTGSREREVIWSLWTFGWITVLKSQVVSTLKRAAWFIFRMNSFFLTHP